MKNKVKMFLLLIVSLVIVYEGYSYLTFQANSYLGIRGGELNHYKSDFIVSINNKNTDTINANIPSPYSKGVNFSFGKNTLKITSLDSAMSFEKDIYFYGIFSWNIIEITSKDFIYSRSYSSPTIE